MLGLQNNWHMVLRFYCLFYVSIPSIGMTFLLNRLMITPMGRLITIMQKVMTRDHDSEMIPYQKRNE